MKTTSFKQLLLAILILCTSLAASHAATTNVAFGGPALTFRPAVVTVNQGDTVTWTQAPGGVSNHTVTGSGADPLCGASIVTSCSGTFSTPGTFLYVCTTHAGFGMTGAVVVVAASLPVVPAVLTNLTVLSNGLAQFQVLSTASHTNHIQASTNLGSTNWTTISTVVPTTNSFIVTDSNAPNFQLRFYRVVQPSL